MRLARLSLFLFVLSFSVGVWAGIDCPSTQFVKDVEFVSADGAEGIWDLLSERFSYADREWKVTFTVYLPKAKTASEALTLGKEYYLYDVNFFDTPTRIETDTKQTCYYAHADSNYFVRAISYK